MTEMTETTGCRNATTHTFITLKKKKKRVSAQLQSMVSHRNESRVSQTNHQPGIHGCLGSLQGPFLRGLKARVSMRVQFHQSLESRIGVANMGAVLSQKFIHSKS
jgi:hypothetical protein